MGVLACDRRGCPRIMCDNTTLGGEDVMHICDECLEELRGAKYSLPEKTTKGEVINFIKTFMDTESGSYTKVNIEEFEDVLGVQNIYSDNE